MAEAADAGRELALLVVAGLVFLSGWLKVFRTGRFYTYMGESLIIIVLVTLWSPAHFLLFDHFPSGAGANSRGRSRVAGTSLRSDEQMGRS